MGGFSLHDHIFPLSALPVPPRLLSLISHIPLFVPFMIVFLLYHSCCYFPVLFWLPLFSPSSFPPSAHVCSTRSFSHLQLRVIPSHNYTLFRSHHVPIRLPAYNSILILSQLPHSGTRYGPSHFYLHTFATLLTTLPFSKSHIQHLQHWDPNTRWKTNLGCSRNLRWLGRESLVAGDNGISPFALYTSRSLVEAVVIDQATFSSKGEQLSVGALQPLQKL